MDLFENTILCKNCGKKMRPAEIEKEGFKMRALKCHSCSNIIIHPSDSEEFQKFKQLRGRQFHVKLRLVGNSYTVSIPKEIVNFINEQEKEINKIHNHMRKQMEEMEKFVTLAMQESNRISLMFNQEQEKENKERKEKPRFTKVGGIKIRGKPLTNP